MAARYALSLLALLGAASAQGYSNSSASAVSSSANSTSVEMPSMTSSSGASSTTYADGSMPTVAGVTFLIQTDTSYTGTTISLARKRQSNAGVGNCLTICAASSSCVGTAYDEDSGICTFYSSIDGDSEMNDPGTTFATVENRASVSPSRGLNATAPSVSGTAYSNSTMRGPSMTAPASRTSSTASSSSTSSTPMVTPDGLLTVHGVEFLIEINVTYAGIFIELDIELYKRAGYTLDSCLTTCADNSNCAGTAFNATTGDCTFYSSITQGSRMISNGTTFGTVVYRDSNSTSTTNANATAESLICPAYNGHVITSSVDVGFAVGCGEFLIGTTFDISLDLTKRQTMNTGLPQTLSNCIDLCSLSSTCVGTVFELATGTCSYYSAVSYAMVVAGYDAGVRVASSGTTTTTVTASPSVTATIYTTSVSTVYVYAPDATAYPSGAVVTTMVPVGTTSYANDIPTSSFAVPTVTIYAAVPTSTVYAAPTSTVTYCPAVSTTWTTVYYG